MPSGADSISVLADHGAYGLGSCASGTDVVEISVTRHAQWEMRVDGSALMRAYGQATLPRPWRRDTAERILGPIELSRIWAIIQSDQWTRNVWWTRRARLLASRVNRPRVAEPAEIVRLGRVDAPTVVATPLGSLDGKASGQSVQFNAGCRLNRGRHLRRRDSVIPPLRPQVPESTQAQCVVSRMLRG